MIFNKMVLGPVDTNAYLIGSKNSDEIALIDPGFEPKRIIEQLEKIQPRRIKILLTHGHFDHTIHLDRIIEHFPDLKLMYHKAEYDPQQRDATEEEIDQMVSAMIRIGQGEAKSEKKEAEEAFEILKECGLFTNIKGDTWLKDGSQIKIGEISLTTLETPGHSPGSLSFYTDDINAVRGHLVDGVLFTGDLLLKRNIGEFAIPGGDKQQIFSSIKDKILDNPEITDRFKVFGGHYGSTTIAAEKLSNPFRTHFL
ncbi:MAG: MBL fold metallo-hydrolase [Promethearchaeia archaeon]